MSWMESLLIQGSGGLFGAFFGVLFGILASIFERKRLSVIDHKKAVVELEHLLNEHLEHLSRAENIAKDMHEFISQGHSTFMRFTLLRLVYGLELRMKDIELINESFTHRETVSAINGDLNTLNRALDLSYQSLLSGRVPLEAQKINANHLAERLSEIKVLLKNEIQETKRFLARARVIFRKIKNVSESSVVFCRDVLTPYIVGDEIEQELQKIDNEIADAARKHQEKLAKLKQDAKT